MFACKTPCENNLHINTPYAKQDNYMQKQFYPHTDLKKSLKDPK